MFQLLIASLVALNMVLVAIGTFLQPVLGVLLVLVTIVLRAVFPLSTLGISFAGFSIYPEDVVGMILLVAGAVRLLAPGKSSRVNLWPLVVFGLALTFSFVRGIQAFSSTGVVVEFRAYFLFLASTLYFSQQAYRPGRQRQLVLGLFAGAWLLVLLALVRWFSLASGLFTFVLGDSEAGWRVLNAAQALYLLEAWVMGVAYQAWCARGEHPPVFSLLTYVLPVVIIMLEHRTVWVSFVIVLGLLFGYREFLGFFRRNAAVIIAVGAVFGMVALWFSGNAFLDSLVFYLREPFRLEGSTIAWRVQGWGSLVGLDYMKSVPNYIWGLPFGTGYARLIYGYVTEVSPHSYYVQTLVRAGVVGVLGLVAMYVPFFKRPYSIANGDVLTHNTLKALMAIQLLNFMTYSALPEHGLILGVGLSLLTLPSRVLQHGKGAQPA